MMFVDTTADDLNTEHRRERDVSTEFSQVIQKEGNSNIKTKLESILNQFS
jgi:hypothetical protein